MERKHFLCSRLFLVFNLLNYSLPQDCVYLYMEHWNTLIDLHLRSSGTQALGVVALDVSYNTTCRMIYGEEVICRQIISACTRFEIED